jgi:uncharacterized protein YdaU (DUF1376 family)
MTKQSVWMPVYIGDYLGDTQRLTTEQHGAYFLLLLDYWRNGPPPADDSILSSITRLKPARFRKHKSTLLSLRRKTRQNITLVAIRTEPKRLQRSAGRPETTMLRAMLRAMLQAMLQNARHLHLILYLKIQATSRPRMM